MKKIGKICKKFPLKANSLKHCTQAYKNTFFNVVYKKWPTLTVYDNLFYKSAKIANFDAMALCGHFVTPKHYSLKDVLTAPYKHDLA